MSSSSLSQQILDFGDSPPPVEQALMGIFRVDGESLGNP